MKSVGKIFFRSVLFSTTVAGCHFIDLGNDLEEMNNFFAINGTIVQENPGDNPVAVALFSDALESEQLLDTKLIESSTFRFDVTPGDYFIFAFEDLNRDSHYQSDEPAGFYGNPSAITIEADSGETAIDVALREDLEFPDINQDSSMFSGLDDKAFPKLWRGRTNIGEVATLDDQKFDPTIGKMGMWEPLRFSKEIGPGIFLLEPYDPQKIPVLFVPGIGGSPRVWRKIIDSLDRQHFQPWVFSYASGLPLEASADYLFEALTQLWIERDFDNLYLVAHSMGGLVAQAFINRDHTSISRYLSLFVTLATPWDGHSAAQIGLNLAPAIIPVWRDIVPGSPSLGKLNNKPLPDDLPYHLLFAHGGGDGFPGSAPNDGTVTIASQLNDAAKKRAQGVYGFDTNHMGIVSDDSAIQLLNDLLEQAHQRTAQ
ncbi:MAG: esterase/lipase family protein [Geminicoccales bacterium]